MVKASESVSIWYICSDTSTGNVCIQIGHSSFGGGSLKRASSCSSAARFLHSFLCLGQCALWHVTSQCLTSLHGLHVLRLSPSLPQLEHVNIIYYFLIRANKVSTPVWKFALFEFTVFNAAGSRAALGDINRLQTNREMLHSVFAYLLPMVTG